MSVTWHNIYAGVESMPHQSPEDAKFYGIQMETASWDRLEQRWNGHWLRPCVGMRAEQASHEWRLKPGYSYGTTVHMLYTNALLLELRHD